ncbi:hypothetical protein MIT9_P2337 [Methylomarinovum caldicuralii]|uniref:Prepilin-type N-terminal cleavage/methylation domain-containing protein n=1 Tax=Methylomarinovum caldicuralii TaxID=438856 RepID=A0AAU9BVH9_9GAMM|nr:hypothetical protein [Methylomarinovum caldicuralii]BCX82751.1 hypothetical protein MIT9_P2337 [Methylomarinovum caldicuralii]
MRTQVTFTRQTGLTLLELVVSLLVMTILTSVAITSVSGIQEQARYEKTVRLLEEFRKAIVGDDDWSKGIRAYAFDMGTLPPNLRALIVPQSPAWRIVTVNAGTDSQFYMGRGWRGPYLYASSSPDDPDALRDSWGGVTNPTYDNDQYYGWVVSPLSPTTSMRIESYGSDSQDGPSNNCGQDTSYQDDCLIDITENTWKVSLPQITLHFLDTTTTTALTNVTTCLQVYYRSPAVALGVVSVTSDPTPLAVTSKPQYRSPPFNFSAGPSVPAGQNYIALFRCNSLGVITNLNNIYPSGRRPLAVDMRPGSTIPVIDW